MGIEARGKEIGPLVQAVLVEGCVVDVGDKRLRRESQETHQSHESGTSA